VERRVVRNETRTFGSRGRFWPAGGVRMVSRAGSSVKPSAAVSMTSPGLSQARRGFRRIRKEAGFPTSARRFGGAVAWSSSGGASCGRMQRANFSPVAM